jgi:YfiH family protein
MIHHNVSGIQYLTYDLFEPYVKATNVVTTRHRGSSLPPFDTLNVGLHVGDDPDAVLENRAAVAQILGFEPEALTLAEQVHGAVVAVVAAGDQGRGSVVEDDALGGADALVTNEPQIPLGILIADCVAVSLYDPARHVVGIAHAGWKGTLARIVEKTVEKMSGEFGTNPKNLVAGLSPSVGRCHYVVGPEVADAYVEEFGDDSCGFVEEEPAGARRLDLWAANRHQLRAAGVPESQIETGGLCTACNPGLFYSYRRDGARTGRIAGIVMLHAGGSRMY